jgi:hypothetical protein
MADVAKKVRETAERLKRALEDLVDDLNSALGRDPQPVLVPVPVRGRGRAYAGVLVERGRRG